ncbi:MAG: MFS transporter [Phycisphaerales bacterium]|nr:MFS transporter [Phycisphaerales bacterium]
MKSRRTIATLIASVVLHAFTHAYTVVLIPLYLLMVQDLHLPGARSASLIVTIYMVVYGLGSYAAGMLADRFNRVWLMGIGQIGNALVIIAMGLVRQYEWLMVLGVLAGLFGTLFHPAANALISAHYPRKTGLGIGLLGIGSGLGFFFGPQYAGWRATDARWAFASVADWQKPLIELGLLGIICGIVFIAVARETRRRRRAKVPAQRLNDMSSDPSSVDSMGNAKVLSIGKNESASKSGQPMTATLRWKVVGIALVLGCRDFAGSASLTLSSLFLQKAMGYDVLKVGLTLGAMMLIGIIANPLAVILSPGGKRLPMLVGTLILGGLTIATIPLWSSVWILWVLSAFQMFQFSSYAISDSAILERVHPDVRGRVAGLFLTLAYTAGALSPLAMGAWVDGLGARGSETQAYLLIYGVLGFLMIFASLSIPLIAGLSRTALRQAK